MRRDNYKTRRITFKFWDLVRLILEVWWCLKYKNGQSDSISHMHLILLWFNHYGKHSRLGIIVSLVQNFFQVRLFRHPTIQLKTNNLDLLYSIWLLLVFISFPNEQHIDELEWIALNCRKSTMEMGTQLPFPLVYVYIHANLYIHIYIYAYQVAGFSQCKVYACRI